MKIQLFISGIRYSTKKYFLTGLVTLIALCSHTSLKAADDYKVLSGTFVMVGGGSPVSIVGNGTFSDNPVPAFLNEGDAVCAHPDPFRVTQCETASNKKLDSSPSTLNGPDSTAFQNGLDVFSFFGSPTFTYFAADGVDTDPERAAAPVASHPPPTIDLAAGTADMSSWYVSWNGTEFNQGNSAANVTDNFDGTYTLDWSSLIVGGPFSGVTGLWTYELKCTSCPPKNPGLAPTLDIVQNAVTTHTVTQGDGNFTVSTNLVSTAGYVFDWKDTDDVIDGGSTTNTNPTVIFDPAAVPPGAYLISAFIVDTNVLPVQVSRATTIVKVVAAGVLADIGDDDNDGVPNINDGIDNTVNPRTLQTQEGNNANFLMNISSGVAIIGKTALCSSKAAAGVSFSNIKKTGGTGCAAAPTDPNVANTVIDNVYAIVTGLGGYFDFEIHGLSQGERVDVTIPLDIELPANASYRKYDPVTGWHAFDTSTGDSVASAASTATGVCPSSYDTSWTSGLTEGDDCIMLRISDGGPNDADGFSNGVIVDPGTISYYPGNDSSRVDLGVFDITSLVMLLLAGWFSFNRRKI